MKTFIPTAEEISACEKGGKACENEAEDTSETASTTAPLTVLRCPASQRHLLGIPQWKRSMIMARGEYDWKRTYLEQVEEYTFEFSSS